MPINMQIEYPTLVTKYQKLLFENEVLIKETKQAEKDYKLLQYRHGKAVEQNVSKANEIKRIKNIVNISLDIFKNCHSEAQLHEAIEILKCI